MKITNLDKGMAYQLAEGAKLEVERTNPFFNDYGESTTPLDIPASDHNRMILGYPDTFGRREKMTANNVSIEDGEYFAQCRQIVLSAQRKGNISSSFYINDGSFYSKIQDVKLKDLFKDEMVPGCNTVDECIAFCRSLIDGNNENYGIFPVLLTDDSGLDTGYNYKMLNGYGCVASLPPTEMWQQNSDGTYDRVFAPDVKTFTLRTFNLMGLEPESLYFEGEKERTEYVNEVPISLDKGYYISPFIRANYVLKRVFKHFGYDLRENFFTKTSPFDKMVLVNNVIDVMVNGHIRVEDLLPDVSVSDFLGVFRKKFLCEFVSDEGTHTADIIFFKDMINASPVADLTRCVTGEPTLSYKTAKDFKRVVLRSKSQVDTDASDSYDDIKDMMSKNTGAYLDPSDGCFYKDGYSGNYYVRTKIGECSQPYDIGDKDFETQDVTIPETMPEFRMLQYRQSDGHGGIVNRDTERLLFIGEGVTLNSSLKVTEEDDTEDEDEDSQTTPIMLAFTLSPYSMLLGGYYPVGTVTAYNVFEGSGIKVFDYSLCYNGEDGIFEKFYKDYDLMLRNSLQDMKVKLLLSQSLKQNLASHAKVVLRGVAFLFNKLKFTLGGKNEPTESEMLTIDLTTPVSEAKSLGDLMPAMSCEYKWVGHETTVQVSKSDYENAGVDKDRTFKVLYPPLPSAEYVGKKYGEQKSYVSQKVRHASFWRHSKWEYHCTTVWLECVKK